MLRFPTVTTGQRGGLREMAGNGKLHRVSLDQNGDKQQFISWRAY